MPKRWLAGLALLMIAFVASFAPRILAQNSSAGASLPEKVPVFDVDPTFPQLPNGWALGNVAKIVVDRHDDVWLIHRPRTVPTGKTSAPAVVEFDPNMKFIQAWGGPAAGYDWPDAEHNIFVDYKDNVWISGSSPSGQSKTKESDDMIIKFTNQGKFLLQIGRRSVSKGSTDTTSVNKPGDLFVWPKTNELFVADGYGNRRVIVFDADTGAFKRMWGAFGKPPKDDANSGGRGQSGSPAADGPAVFTAPLPLDTESPGLPTFSSPVHSVVVSNDGVVYVADRTNRRVQVFTPTGKYITQFFVNRGDSPAGSACGLAFSPDKAQKFLYVADYGNSHIVVINRKKLTVLYQFGKRGAGPGDFRGVHHLAVDSKGNIYTAEVAPGARAQRFLFKGMSATLPPNAFTSPEPPSAPPSRSGSSEK